MTIDDHGHRVTVTRVPLSPMYGEVSLLPVRTGVLPLDLG